jgi:hypothetical protein
MAFSNGITNAIAVLFDAADDPFVAAFAVVAEF